MGVSDPLTIIIAAYGAIVSTILGIRELRKERRQISVILEYVDVMEKVQVTIVNSGYRPITITGISMALPMAGPSLEKVPSGILFSDELDKWPFPVTLTDGQHISLLLSDDLTDSIVRAKMDIKLKVFDAEGNIYSKYKIMRYDTKGGGYYKY